MLTSYTLSVIIWPFGSVIASITFTTSLVCILVIGKIVPS